MVILLRATGKVEEVGDCEQGESRPKFMVVTIKVNFNKIKSLPQAEQLCEAI